jgi:DNA-binding NarL/FixJ family response regulator
MSKKVLLVGHCGPDSSYLRLAVRSADPAAQILAADAPGELDAALAQGIDLVLLNRELGYDFEPMVGVDLIARLKQSHPGLKTMLISNYADAQAAAVAAGAVPGFGKREIGSPRAMQLLRSALQSEHEPSPPSSTPVVDSKA